jgi:dihydrofolate reductase
MRKLKLQVQITVDGFIAGQNGEMNWMSFNWTDDIKKYVSELTEPVDTILLGKNLAAGFIPHWAAVAKDNNNPEKEAGVKFSETPKIVFSKTLTQSEWENTVVENEDFVEKIKDLKEQSSSDIIVYGGGKFVSSLVRENLIDELHLFVNPAILGKGMPIFQEVHAMQKLNLVKSKQFECGIIVLVYKPA